MTNSCAPVMQEIRDANRILQLAGDAAAHGDWTRTEQALIEAQDRIGRLLREIALRRSAPRHWLSHRARLRIPPVKMVLPTRASDGRSTHGVRLPALMRSRDGLGMSTARAVGGSAEPPTARAALQLIYLTSIQVPPRQ